MKRFSVLVCLLFGAALLFAAAPGGQPEPAGHIVQFQHMLQAYLQNCFGGGESEDLLLDADGPGPPQNQNQARNQTCDPDCDPPLRSGPASHQGQGG